MQYFTRNLRAKPRFELVEAKRFIVKMKKKQNKEKRNYRISEINNHTETMTLHTVKQWILFADTIIT